MRHGTGMGWVALVCLGSATRLAQAESVERGALSLDGAIVVSQSTELTPSAPEETLIESIEESNTSFGLLGGGFGFGAAYGVSNNVVIAGQLLFSSRNFESKTNLRSGGITQSSTFTFDSSEVSLIPRFEYVFADSSAVRPFLAGMVQIAKSSSTSGETEVTRDIYGIGAGFGLHAFVSPHFSIDPLLSVMKQGGTQDTTDSASNLSSTVALSGTLVALTVSFSGWFGGAPQAGPAQPSETLPPAASVLPAPPPRTAAPADDDAAELPPVKTTQGVPGDHAVMLKGRPEALPTSIMIRLAENSKGQALKECREVKLVAGAHSYRVEPLAFRGRRRVGSEMRSVSDGLLPLDAIDLAVNAEDARLDVCGETWPLTPAARAAFLTFLTEFRKRGGAPAKEPTEPTPAETPAPQPETGTPGSPPAAAAPPPPGSAAPGSFPIPAPAPPVAPKPVAPAPPLKPPLKPR